MPASADPPRAPSAAVLVIGNEILTGRTRDANLQILAGALAPLGIRIREARVVEDGEQAIVAAVTALRGAYDYVFTTGGIGPTHDDITTDSIARAFGVPVHDDPVALGMLRERYRDDELNAARLRMARIPAGAVLIPNPATAAPGFRLGNVFVLPGIPSIMQAMLPALLPGLATGPALLSRSITAFARESDVAAGLGAIQAAHPELELGSYPFLRDGRYGTSLVIRGTDPAALGDGVAAVAAMLAGLNCEYTVENA